MIDPPAAMRERWSKIGNRSYKRSSPKFDAFIFGADRPYCLWAWSIYWVGGNKSRVENGFTTAKKKANESIASLLRGLSLKNSHGQVRAWEANSD